MHVCAHARTPLPFLCVIFKRGRGERRSETPGNPLSCCLGVRVCVVFFSSWCSPSAPVAPRQLLLRLLFISPPQCPPASLPLCRCLASREKGKAAASSTRRVYVCVEKGGEAPAHAHARRGTERGEERHARRTDEDHTAARERPRRHTQEADLLKHPHAHVKESPKWSWARSHAKGVRSPSHPHRPPSWSGVLPRVSDDAHPQPPRHRWLRRVHGSSSSDQRGRRSTPSCRRACHDSPREADT